jgi:hypothetical protein
LAKVGEVCGEGGIFGEGVGAILSVFLLVCAGSGVYVLATRTRVCGVVSTGVDTSPERSAKSSWRARENSENTDGFGDEEVCAVGIFLAAGTRVSIRGDICGVRAAGTVRDDFAPKRSSVVSNIWSDIKDEGFIE